MPRFVLSDGVLLRPLEEADGEELYALVEENRPHLARWMPWAAGQTREGATAFIRKAIKQEQDEDAVQVAMLVDGAIVGVLGHEIDRQNSSTTIGYWLAAQHQGKGLMTAAVERLVSHAFDELNLNRVELEVAPDNSRSRALAERLGFREEGVLREAERFAEGDYRDLVVYSMLAFEREARRCRQGSPRGG
jgi:ribosomal-protein-serine acetyltransferase